MEKSNILKKVLSDSSDDSSFHSSLMEESEIEAIDSGKQNDDYLPSPLIVDDNDDESDLESNEDRILNDTKDKKIAKKTMLKSYNNNEKNTNYNAHGDIEAVIDGRNTNLKFVTPIAKPNPNTRSKSAPAAQHPTINNDLNDNENNHNYCYTMNNDSNSSSPFKKLKKQISFGSKRARDRNRRGSHLNVLIQKKNLLKSLNASSSFNSIGADNNNDTSSYHRITRENVTEDYLCANDIDNNDSNDNTENDRMTKLHEELISEDEVAQQSLRVKQARKRSMIFRELFQLSLSPECMYGNHDDVLNYSNNNKNNITNNSNDDYNNVEFPLEVRIRNLSYKVPIDPQSNKIKTVYNSSVIYDIYKYLQRVWENKHLLPNHKNINRQQRQYKNVLDDINLVLQPGKMYLILGDPGSGKTSLLKAIAGRLPTSNGEIIEGTVAYNGKTLQDKSQYHIKNAVAYIDQLDRHAPRLTVNETFQFAFQCKVGTKYYRHNKKKGRGGNIISTNNSKHDKEKEMRKQNFKKRQQLQVNVILETLGLDGVKDTFVGDTETVRGVSGGQRRRVTVGEMLMERTPILCADEISTGLDSSSSYEMIQLLVDLGRITKKMTRVISLLQPTPEIVSLFDDVILIKEGKVLFAGPIYDVEKYFNNLGYYSPEQMDVAEFVTSICTPDAISMFQPSKKKSTNNNNYINDDRNNNGDHYYQQQRPYTTTELSDIFRESEFFLRIKKKLNSPLEYVWDKNDIDRCNQEHKREQNSCSIYSTARTSPHFSINEESKVSYIPQWYAVQSKYMNTFWRSTTLNMKRSIIIWRRNKRLLIATFIKNLIMGISVGGVFFQTTDEVSVLGCLFQAMLFIMLGAMQIAPGLVEDRNIYQKHADANFFSPFPFVLGRLASQLPQSLMDVFTFGTVLYFMIGLTPTAANFFTFISILFVFSILMNQFLSVFAAIAPTKSTVQVMSACVVLFLILFGGFIVPPNAIPVYYLWVYWINPFAWAYRAVIVNEYQSSRYNGHGIDDNETGDAILRRLGFVGQRSNEPFQKEWVFYGFLFMIPFFVVCVVETAVGLQYLRKPSSGSGGIATITAEESTIASERIAIPFIPVTLTFEDICYDVKASTSKENLRLLHNVNGIFRSGRMCALMGSSGAGKTTLMDVIALRKNSGTCFGDVRLNGYLQDAASFRRASGYVEQFDVQSPELTVRETVLFSAKLRLNPQYVQTDEEKGKFVHQVLNTLELENLSHCLVGSDEESTGLSFEQKKRLSIAVELAASPSIIFLDEPTSGLDARSALLVIKLLRRIADEGRTICATIHQPSSAVFEMFHDLLLLKTGGEVVYFGELGENSNKLIRFFESHGAHGIDLNENPANWVLDALSSTSFASNLSARYKESEMFKSLKHELADIKVNLDPRKKITYAEEFAASFRTRLTLVGSRIRTIYWRSPAYNLSRMIVSLAIAFILGSIFITNRRPEKLTESDMRAWFAVIFLSFIIVGILSMLSVLPVMVKVRDMYYRHRAAGMIESTSLAWALGTAEKWFVVLSSILFCLVFILVSGIDVSIKETISFWGFFTFNIAIYSYFGQAFVCFVKPMATAQILASVFIGLNNFFSGFIVRPQFLTTGFFQVPFWITPGHFVYEGMVVSIFARDKRTVVANSGTDFYEFLQCSDLNITTECSGTVANYVDSYFGGQYVIDNTWKDAVILGSFLVLARVLTFLALRHINFSSA